MKTLTSLSSIPVLTLVLALPAQQQELEILRGLIVSSSSYGMGSLNRLQLNARATAQLAEPWFKKDSKAVVSKADAMIRDKPLGFGGYGVKYLALLELVKDRPAARKFAMQAVGALTKKPDQLVTFIHRALYVSAGVEEYRIALMALATLVPDARDNAAIRIAHLQALEGCGKVKEALVTNKNIVEDLGKNPRGLMQLAQAICKMKNRVAFAPIAKRALDLAAKSLPETRDYLKARYSVLRVLASSPDDLEKIANKIIKSVGVDDLNNFVWYLMTTEPDAGHFDQVALVGARRMQKATMIMNNEHDTIALAFFRNGFFDDAIRHQRIALKMGKQDDPDYEARLKIYIAAKKKRDASQAKKRK